MEKLEGAQEYAFDDSDSDNENYDPEEEEKNG